MYAAGDAEKWKKRAGRVRAAAWGCLLAGTAACVFLCTKVNTGNAHRLLITVIAVFALAGWAAILLRRLFYAPARAEAAHVSNLLTGEKEEYEGIVSGWDREFTIPRGIAVRRLILRQGEEPMALHVDARRAHLLPPPGTKVRLEARRKFVTGWEALHE